MSEPKKIKYSSKEDNSDNSNLKFIQLIESVQDELGSLQDEFEKDILRLEKKYEYQRKPMYIKREEAISSIPNFWLTAMMNHPEISHLMTDADEEYLKYLVKLDCEGEFQNHKQISFKITFHFKENPYFENKTLVKNYTEIESKEKKNVVVSGIDWKDGQDASEKLQEKKSFLCWLSTANYLPDDFEIALAIKEDLWVNPLHFFLISDEMADSGSEDDSDDDVVIFDDSDEGKSPIEEPEYEEEESDNDTDYDDSPLSTEVPQSDN